MSTWPYDCPGAGPVGEHELDAAWWRKRQITLTPEQAHDMDDTAGLCSVCGGECTTPQACEQPERHSRQRRSIVYLGVALGAAICAVCLAGYLRTPL